MRLEDLDKNFAVATISDRQVHFLDAASAPFALEGLPFGTRTDDGAPFCRLPDELMEALACENADAVPAIRELRRHTAGAAIRFRARSASIAIRYSTRCSYDMNHMTRCGSAGFDLFRRLPGDLDYRFMGSVQINRPEGPERRASGEQLIKVAFGVETDAECDYLLNLPLYGGVEKIELGFAPGALLLPPRPHRIPKPVCFYGSSITQGGCASRPGNCYSSHLCRAVDAEQVNLGFSGNAKGEECMAKLIATLDLSCFVLDYDHNAPSPEHLRKTYATFFRTIRKAHPDLPVILVSRPDSDNCGDDPSSNRRRREVIRQTYLDALAQGDRKVWFVDGRTLFGTTDRDACTVDGCHPNDLGFYRMFQAILPHLQKALGI